jgi:small-conductance mechanosensitive channel
MDALVSSDAAGILQFLVLDRVPYALFIILIAVVGGRFLTRFFEGMGTRFASYRLLLKQVSAVARFTILVVTAGLVITNVVQLTDQAILALGGTVAVAVGFAFKDLLAALMAGIILLFDRPFVVGDRVEFGGTYGEVVEIGLRTVRIVTLDDNLVSIPNNRFLSDAVSCANAGALDQMCVYKFYIGCREDFTLARRLAYEATATSRFVFLQKPIAVHVREGPVPGSDTAIAIHIIVKAYVLDGRFESAFGTDVTERVLRALRTAGVRTIGEIYQDEAEQRARALAAAVAAEAG